MLLFIVAPLHSQPPPSTAPPGEDITPTFKTGVADVRVDVQVTQGSKIVRNLKKEDFAVSDNGQSKDVVYFAHGDEPLSIVLLLDVSGSMQRWLNQIAATARDALNQLRPGDKVAVMVFGKTSDVHQDFSDNLAESARQIAKAIHEHDVGAGTAINQSIIDAAKFMDTHADPLGRRAILILTDNLSISVKVPDEKVIRALDDANTVLNAIVVGRGIRPDPTKEAERFNPEFTPADVFKLAEQTGGLAVKAERADSSFRDMIDRIRSRYTLAYHLPEDAQPGSFRHIQAALTTDAKRFYPAAELHARAGYFVK